MSAERIHLLDQAISFVRGAACIEDAVARLEGLAGQEAAAYDAGTSESTGVSAPGAGRSVAHLYGQSAWHDEALVIGTADALRHLQEAIGRALAERHARTEVFAADGEGYTIHVVVVNEKEAARLRVPYTDPVAAGHADAALDPWGLARALIGGNEK